MNDQRIPLPPSDEPRRGYLRGLDGLRFAAVIIVVLGHFRLSTAIPGGFGVTIFFAISGFLISRLLLAEETRTGEIALGPFFARRFIRLIPPLIIMFAVTLPIYWLVDPGSINVAQLLLALFYLGNFFTLGQVVGLLPDGGVHGYGVLWSLAVEEHFYLFFPLFLVFVRNFNTRLWALCSIIFGSLVLRLIIYAAMPMADDVNYYFTFTRLDSIAWGCLLTLMLVDPRMRQGLRPLRGLGGFAFAVALLLGGIAFRNDFFQETFRYSLHGLGMFLLLNAFVFGTATNGLMWIAEWKPVRWGGRTSYEIYLWHTHIYFFTSLVIEPYWIRLPVALIITGLVSHFAYQLTMAGTRGVAARFGSQRVEDVRKELGDEPGALAPNIVARPTATAS
ncbi:acyltransferase [Kaistia dalseonensis]|uniref:Peptidoglycan/LPS O-acetylase OafA/YrhL n=1 Tax=Kaistia dalseonensis TaxID=410840 RepID=A0ABU0H354_9HYPH|nr:acyltransferase [Kaistia dalseonensis]MCX5493769.1 acyltransferase [Kaistia dalseonensis]MDQ0436333.1 peptidoglycan/LPS O-acetylase OafA/YrhL [Kaistia dalseonensis]